MGEQSRGNVIVKILKVDLGETIFMFVPV